MSVPRDITMASVRKLKRGKRNARTHSKKQIRQIANSILQFGWTYPLLVDEDSCIIAGHGRLEAAELLGLREVPVMVLSGLSEAEKRALALADNKISANAGWDRSVLATELGELAKLLPECDLAIDITGFEQAEVDTLLLDLDDPEQDPLDEIPPLAQSPVTRGGDLLQLNQHSLLCGDAQRALDFRKLLGAERAALCITDPPYNLHVPSVQGRGRIKHRNFIQAAGEMSQAEFTAFLSAALAHAAKYSVSGAIHFVFMDWRHISEMLSAGSAVYSELKNVVVWVKTNAGQGSFYRSQHELIFVFKSGEAPHVNNIELGRFGRNRSNVWSYAGVNTFRAGRLEDLSAHPTAKPVALVVDAMRDCSRRGDIILDPFMGAGTTIMAAERVGRRAYGLELDPLYVDAAVRRWQAFTGRDAILKSTGQTFEELAAARINAEAGAMVEDPRRDRPRLKARSSAPRNRTGYGKPPKEYRFQPGQSGNRKGRPKGVKNTATLLREILDRKIEVRSNNSVRKISVREAMLTRFAESALKGDTKSATFLLQRYDIGEDAQEHPDNSPTQEEQEIIDKYMEAYLKRKGDKR